MSNAKANVPAPAVQHPIRIFLTANFVYLWAVHGWGLGIYALGRDFSAFAVPDSLGGAAGYLFRAQAEIFGGLPHGYHVVSFLLLYLCVVATFFLTRLLVGGPWWLGSVAAVLMMAHPLKSEAVLNLSGIEDLLPAACVLWGMVLLLASGARYQVVRMLVAAGLLVIAASGDPAWGACLVLGPMLVDARRAQGNGEESTGETCAPCGRFAWVSFILLGILAVVAVAQGVAVGAILSSLLPVYAIGFSPEMVFWMGSSPLFSGLLLAFAVVFWLVAFRAIRVVVFRRLLLGALTLHVAFAVSFGRPVDLVTFEGGGREVVVIALMALALAAVCREMITWPRWPRHVVFLTTLLCIAFMALQFRSVLAWQHASAITTGFQARAILTLEEARRTTGAGELMIAPDFHYYRDAPLRLSESIRFDTPFSRAISARTLATLRYYRPETMEVRLLPEGALRVDGVRRAGVVLDAGGGGVEEDALGWQWWLFGGDGGVPVFEIPLKERPQPGSIIPLRNTPLVGE